MSRILVAVCFFLLCRMSLAEQYAVIVGTNKYNAGQLRPLAFADADAMGMVDALSSIGFKRENISVLAQLPTLNSNPTYKNIVRKLSTTLSKCREGDTVVLAFSGHGIQYVDEEESYYCPADVDLERRRNLLSHTLIHQLLDECKASVKLLFIDACRDKYETDRKAVKEEELAPAFEHLTEPPTGVVACYSCSGGQFAYEDADLGHGVFFHFLIEAFRGASDKNGDGQIALNELEDFIKDQTSQHVLRKLGSRQQPEVFRQSTGLPALKIRNEASRRVHILVEQSASGEVVRATGENRAFPKVLFVRSNSAAARSGLKAGDFVVRINSQLVDAKELGTKVRSLSAPVQMSIVQNGRERTVTLAPDKPIKDSLFAAEILKAANRGKPMAQYAYAVALRLGAGVTWDKTVFKEWVAKAANSDLPEALIAMAGIQISESEASTEPEKLKRAAFALHTKAAQLGFARAQTQLGVDYALGRGIAKSDSAARSHYQDAAAQGDALAQNNLGWHYQSGIGGQKSFEKAVYWYGAASEQNLPGAHVNLGALIGTEKRLPTDIQSATRLFRKAARFGEAEAAANVSVIYAQGMGVAKNDRQAREWARRGALLGSARAAFLYASLLKSAGPGSHAGHSADPIRWWHFAADLDHSGAMYELGWSYWKGEGTRKSIGKAIKWFRRAANHEHGTAMLHLGQIFMIGEVVEKDETAAVDWYRKAASANQPVAQFLLGLCCYNGDGTDQDDDEALKWFRKSAAQGNRDGQYSLGGMYFNGRGVKTDLRTAKSWFQKAAAQGHERAIDMLQRYY